MKMGLTDALSAKTPYYLRLCAPPAELVYELVYKFLEAWRAAKVRKWNARCDI